MAHHKNVTIETGLGVYLPNPLAGLTQDDVDGIAAKLNAQPRKSLGYSAPAKLWRWPVESKAWNLRYAEIAGPSSPPLVIRGDLMELRQVVRPHLTGCEIVGAPLRTEG